MLATSFGDVCDFVDAIVREPQPVGFDLETTGIKAERSDIIGIALATKRRTLYVPTMHRDVMRDRYDGALIQYAADLAEYDAEREAGTPKRDRKWAKKPTKPARITVEQQVADLPLWQGNIGLAAALTQIARLFTYTNVPLIAHNGPFDLRHLREQARQMGVMLPFPRGHYHDSLLMSYALSDHLEQAWGGLDLDTVANRVLGERKDDSEIQDFLDAMGAPKGKQKRKLMMQWCPAASVGKYAERDATLALQLVGKLLPRLRADAGCSAVYAREIALVEATVAMEETEKWIDIEYVNRTIAHGELRLAELRADVTKAAGVDFNVDSPQDTAEVLRGLGIRLPYADATVKAIEEGREPKKVAYSTDVKVLEPYRHLPVVSGLLRYRALGKRIGTDFAGVREHAVPHVHSTDLALLYPGLSQTTARTGRYSCLAAGTPIEVVRDVAARPTVAIEDVRAGDLVYCFDDNRQLTLRTVLWAGQTGVREVIRLHWIGSGRKRRGWVDLTPEHRVRLWSGEYREAAALRPNDRILAMSRAGTAFGYERLWASNHAPIALEHRWVYETLNGPVGRDHVHHIDANKKNAVPTNLQRVTPQQHIALHPATSARRAKNGAASRQMWAEGRGPAPRYGVCNPRYVPLDKEWMLAVLWKHGGKPTAFRDHYNIDHEKAMQEIARHEIDWQEIKLQHRPDGTRITREDVVRAQGMPQIERLRFIGKNFYAFRKLQEFFGLEVPFNHNVVRVERRSGAVPVFDIEVEGTHNFIANELCVHNSSKPNFHNWSRDDETDEWAEEFSIRRCMIANPETQHCTVCGGDGAGGHPLEGCEMCGGWGTLRRLLIDVDLKQIEPRITAHLTRDPNLIKVYLEGRDVYVEIGKVAFAIDLVLDDKAWKKARPDERQAAKSLVLAILYGAGMSKVAVMVVDSVLSTIDGRFAMLKRKLLASRKGGLDAYSLTPEAVDKALAEMRALKARRQAFKFDQEDARRVINKMNDRFPGIFDYKDYLSDWYERNGYIRNPWGRKLYLQFADATYTLLNAMVQSSAADLFKQATIDCFFALSREGLDCRMIWTIHDALIFDCAAHHAERAVKLIRHEMCKFKLRVPLEIDVCISAGSWADGVEVDIDKGIPWEQVWATARPVATADTSTTP